MMTSSEIRQHFFDFFKSKGHTIIPSAPIVVKDDPTLMFTNAGMNQFKDYFLGNKKPQHTRVADTQKCLRVSGKHNDLEEVGVDTYHHTMFEMLGNWSFGDYFKEEAIAWSWELLTGVYKVAKDRLYVSVFEGDEKENLPRDEEAISFWKKWVSEDRIIMGNKKDNFWEMGDTGPCGPCTEIHVDSRTDEERKTIDGKSLVNNDHPQVIEIWNNVFIQYNRKKDGSLEPLPAKHVDTGMGFERLVRVLQNKQSNYDTDVFAGTIAEVEKLSGKKYNAAENQSSQQTSHSSPSTGGGWGEAVAFRVIADHIRAIAFPIADGQLPSNTGAGYVIRRILRRAVRYYFSYLDVKQPLLHNLIPLLAKQFENVFPELDKQKEFIGKLIKREEEMFLKTLELGLRRFNTYIDPTNNSVIINPEEDTMTHINIKEDYRRERSQKTIAGEFAFELNDTFGFPIDLTKLIAAEKGFTVDEEGFEKALHKQKERSRAASILETGDWVVLKDGDTSFVGYDSLETKAHVIKYRKVNDKGNEFYQIVLDKTPFYAESGGQVGDNGELNFSGLKIQVFDTKKENNLIIHFTETIPEDLSGVVIALVDAKFRTPVKVHHSATHLLHAALREVLGEHVEQKGSLVNGEYLRFDFSHFQKMSNEEISKVEKIVNQKIRANIAVEIKIVSKEEGIEMGARALFGEKYGDNVRVVIMDFDFSKELCGGTHVSRTGELGVFKIKQETAIGSGLRRIEAVSGKAAEDYINQQFETIRVIRDILKNPKDFTKEIENLVLENTGFKKQLEKIDAKNIESTKDELLKRVEKLNGINFIGEIIETGNPDVLKKICFFLKKELKDYVVVLAADIDRKPHIAIIIDEEIAVSKNLEAPKIIKEHIAPLIKGGGGGQKTLATAGGQDASRLNEVIEKVKSLL